jgi:2-oxoisovalerate dehydrogenase E2 component (dihydrolipoyl transacylase)
VLKQKCLISGEYIPCRSASSDDSYSHTLDLTPLLPYIKAANPPPATSRAAYLASDIPPSLVGTATEGPSTKTTLLSFLVKSMLLAMEEHPIMRAKVIGQDNDRVLEIRRDGVIGVAVSGMLTLSRSS